MPQNVPPSMTVFLIWGVVIYKAGHDHVPSATSNFARRHDPAALPNQQMAFLRSLRTACILRLSAFQIRGG